MKIQVDKQSDHYRADLLDAPGSPPVGLGATPEMAVACLFWRLMFENTGGSNPTNWLKFIAKNEPIIVNDVMWDWPASYKLN